MNKYRQAYPPLKHPVTERSLERAGSSGMWCWENVQSTGQLCEGLVHDQSCVEKRLISEEVGRKGRLSKGSGRQRQEVGPLSSVMQWLHFTVSTAKCYFSAVRLSLQEPPGSSRALFVLKRGEIKSSEVFGILGAFFSCTWRSCLDKAWSLCLLN